MLMESMLDWGGHLAGFACCLSETEYSIGAIIQSFQVTLTHLINCWPCCTSETPWLKPDATLMRSASRNCDGEQLFPGLPLFNQGQATDPCTNL